MAQPRSVLNLVVDRMLPEDLRDPERIYDKKGVDELMTRVAQGYPDLYPKITKALGDLGRHKAYERGETFSLEDFEPAIDRQPYFDELDKKVDAIRAKKLPTAERDAELAEVFADISERIGTHTSREALAKRNNIALTVVTGARGKADQLKSLISTPGYFQDSKGKLIPIFSKESFAEGLRPAAYLAGTYGARDAVTGSKRAVAQGGFLSKTLSRASARMVVTRKDCGTKNGILLPVDEQDIRGRVLQQETAGVPAGSVIDRKVLARLRASDADQVMVRSPITCENQNGICAHCYGVKAEGKFPEIGDHVGATSSNALGEPLAQGALNKKHSIAAKGASREFAGLDYLQQFMESPEEFKDKATVSEVEDRVSAVEPAPQGGSYVTVGGHIHYVPQSSEVIVKPGDMVEAGDQLSDGLVDPEDIVRLRGLGEGRKYYAEGLSKIAKASGAGMDRRQFEVLSRANIDHIDLDDPDEDGFLPDDTVRYSSYVHRVHKPGQSVIPNQAVGKFLAKPLLHHTVGTKLTNRMVGELTAQGHQEIPVTDEAPGFKPRMIRLQQVGQVDDDWLASLGSSFLGKQINEGITRAQDTNIDSNYHPLPRMVTGMDYAKNIRTTGTF